MNKKNTTVTFKQIKDAAQTSDKDLLRIKADLPPFSGKIKNHEKVMEVFKTLDNVTQESLINVDHISELADIYDSDQTKRAIQRTKREFVITHGKVIFNKPGVGYKVADDKEALEEAVKGVKRGMSHFNNTRNAQHNCHYKYNSLSNIQKKDKKMVDMLTSIIDVIANHQSKELNEAMEQMKVEYSNRLLKAKKEEEQ